MALFQSPPGLAFLHRLVLGIPLGCPEVGACGLRLVGLLLQLTGLDRLVAASSGTPQQVNRQVEEALVASRHEESARLAQDMPAQAITLAKDYQIVIAHDAAYSEVGFDGEQPISFLQVPGEPLKEPAIVLAFG